MRITFRNLCLIVAAVAILPLSPAIADHHLAVQRLGVDVIPQKYDLYVVPRFKTNDFLGEETITLAAPKSGIVSVLLHAKELTLSQAEVISAGQRQKVEIKAEPSEEMVRLAWQTPITGVPFQLKLKFKGILNDQLAGFYRSTWKDAQGRIHNLASTQMEPADARRMFPCFDEPQFKATFKISARVPREMTAISNAAVVRQVVSGTTRLIEFEETPKMSSYLVALVVGEMEATPPVVVQNVPIRVWSVKGKKGLGIYSRDQAAKVLPFLTGYFGVPYTWKKLDMIAIPDFEAGAMENPGAITFREKLLLIDPVDASSGTKRSAVSVIAHEMAHLWFGDLVTMQWWDDIWLNEAFATWMETKAVDAIHPEWQWWKTYANEREGSMDTDALRATRTIHSDVRNPEQAHEMFDVITYAKGASVLRMLERYVGEPVFQKGVHQYLEKFAYGNAATKDLWDSIGAVSGQPVDQIMNTWVNQPGFPLLSVGPSSRPGSLDMSQQRFLSEGLGPQEETLRWRVPVGIRVLKGAAPINGQSHADRKYLLTEQTGTVPVLTDEELELPVLANAGGVGYYRVRYPETSFRKLIDAASKQLDPSERFSLLDDTWSITFIGEFDIVSYLDLLGAVKNDEDELVWGAILGQVSYLQRVVEPTQKLPYQRFVRDQLSTLYRKLGWEPKPNELQQTRILRGRMLTTLGTIGQDPQVIKTARELYAGIGKSSKRIDPDLMTPITTIVAFNGGARDYDHLLVRYQTARTPEEEGRALHALTEFQAPQLVGRTLQLGINGKVRTQDAPMLISSLISHQETAETAWDFLEKNWKRITTFYPEQMVRGVVGSAGWFNTDAMHSRIKEFFGSHPIVSGESTVARALESSAVNVKFRKNSAAKFNQWLAQRFGKP